MAEARIAVIGGSGLYQMEGLTGVREVDMDTPFGKPSDAIVLGELERVPVAFLPRHGRGHRLSPTEVPARANVYALKKLGVERIISVTAVGSLREEMRPLDMVVLDQLIDRTRQRAGTFFGDGIVVHVGFADPFCAELRRLLVEAARETGARVHDGGTCVVMEGPAFSTRAESEMHRSWGGDLIGMTVMPEAKLAREAELAYALVALPSDYDCWRPTPDDLDKHELLKEIIANLTGATRNAVELIQAAVTRFSEIADEVCPAHSALELAIWSNREMIPPATRKHLGVLVEKYL